MVENDEAFDPKAPCTRAAAVQYIWRAKGAEQAVKAAAFTDISNDPADPLFQAVSWAVEQGVTSGTSETAFSPNDICTRGQIVTFLYRAFAGQKEQPENQDTEHPVSDVDMSKIKGLYRQEENPEYEIEAQFSNPRIEYVLYLNSEKYGRKKAGEGLAKISGTHAYVSEVNDSGRVDLWFYPDSLICEFSRPSPWNGKYILVDPQEEAQKQRQQEEKDRQMDEKHPASDVDMREIDALYRLDGSDRYQISVWYNDPQMSFTLEDRQEEDIVDVPYSGLNISGTHAYFDSEKHNYRTDIWFYPDYLILEFSREGAGDYQQYAGRYTLHWSGSGQN